MSELHKHPLVYPCTGCATGTTHAVNCASQNVHELWNEYVVLHLELEKAHRQIEYMLQAMAMHGNVKE